MKNEQFIATPSRTRQIFDQYNFSFKKSLGQNFLIDVNILKNIIKQANITKSSGVIEIGPGIGALTEQLALHAKQVVAYEIDERLKQVLQDTLKSYDNVHIIYSDILKSDVQAAINDYLTNVSDIHIVANLPYYITTPIVMKLLKDRLPIKQMTIMIQKEVAQRMAAQPGTKDYGSLSVAVQYYTKAESVMDISPHVFMPQPRVESSVLTLKLREKPPVDVHDERYFFKIVRASFAQRRKTLRNNLISYFQKKFTREQIDQTIKQAEIDPQQRGETLTIAMFARLANAFYTLEL